MCISRGACEIQRTLTAFVRAHLCFFSCFLCRFQVPALAHSHALASSGLGCFSLSGSTSARQLQVSAANEETYEACCFAGMPSRSKRSTCSDAMAARVGLHDILRPKQCPVWGSGVCARRWDPTDFRGGHDKLVRAWALVVRPGGL